MLLKTLVCLAHFDFSTPSVGCSPFASTLAQGKFVLVLDDEDRENEGDLIIAAEKTRTEDMAFLVRYSR
jgi:3,4-dihydroxy-2-butanone 4-phosphate synthase